MFAERELFVRPYIRYAPRHPQSECFSDIFLILDDHASKSIAYLCCSLFSSSGTTSKTGIASTQSYRYAAQSPEVHSREKNVHIHACHVKTGLMENNNDRVHQ